MAQGNLGAHMQPATPGSLLHGPQTMIGALRGAIEQVHGASQNIRTATDEIAVGNLDLSQRTEETTSSLRQTAASLEHLTQTMHQTAAAAHSATELTGATVRSSTRWWPRWASPIPPHARARRDVACSILCL
jgi:methyl-accepting chemotaxis protein